MNREVVRGSTRVLGPLTALSGWALNQVKRQRVIIMYHGISKTPRFNCVTEELFKEQLQWLKENYHLVSVNELVSDLHLPLREGKNMAAITFDDGYTSFYELGVPILRDSGCHATVFVPSGKVGGYNDWDKRLRNFEKLPVMSYQMLRQLPDENCDIGSHGISHVALDILSREQACREITVSRLQLEEGVGRRVDFLAFPFGRVPQGWASKRPNVSDLCLTVYKGACTTWWGRYNTAENLYSLRRIGVWDCDSLADFERKLGGHYDWIVVKERLGRLWKRVCQGVSVKD